MMKKKEFKTPTYAALETFGNIMFNDTIEEFGESDSLLKNTASGFMGAALLIPAAVAGGAMAVKHAVINKYHGVKKEDILKIND